MPHKPGAWRKCCPNLSRHCLRPILQVGLVRAPEMGFDTYALEIGFGGGEHLAACAKAAPQTGFIGCEPFINGVAKLLGQIEIQGGKSVCTSWRCP